MDKFLLVSVFDREILLSLYNTIVEARNQMQTEMILYGDIPKEMFELSSHEEDSFGFTEVSGWANSRYDCGWKIIPVADLERGISI